MNKEMKIFGLLFTASFVSYIHAGTYIIKITNSTPYKIKVSQHPFSTTLAELNKDASKGLNYEVSMHVPAGGQDGTSSNAGRPIKIESNGKMVYLIGFYIERLNGGLEYVMAVIGWPPKDQTNYLPDGIKYQTLSTSRQLSNNAKPINVDYKIEIILEGDNFEKSSAYIRANITPQT